MSASASQLNYIYKIIYLSPVPSTLHCPFLRSTTAHALQSLIVDSLILTVKVSDSPRFPTSSFSEGSHVRRALRLACDNKNTHFLHVTFGIRHGTTP